MLQNIRDNSQGWIAKTIIGVIVLLLSLTGFEAIFGGFRSGSLAAKVNGEAISQSELEQAVQIQAAQLAQQLSERLGANFDVSRLDEKELRESALRGLIERRLLLQTASEEKLRFSAKSLDQLILQTPEFQQDGKFSAERFDQAVRSMGYSRMQYRSLLEAEMLIAQMRLGLVSSGFVTDEEVQAFARLERQTRSFASLRFAAQPEQVKVSDEDIRAWYDAHANDYMSPEQVVVQYLELKKQDFIERATVTEEALQAAYQREIASLAEQRNAAQAALYMIDAQRLLSAPPLLSEMFGPAAIVVRARTTDELLQVAEHLEGQLTATLQLDDADHDLARRLLPVLERKAGRILANGFPTGVEVCHAMVHGGPFPSTSNAMFTSVGASAIDRFLRPVCYQDLPDALRPDAIKDANPLGLRRMTDGAFA